MNTKNIGKHFITALKQVLVILTISILISSIGYVAYWIGYLQGHNFAIATAQEEMDKLLAELNLQVSSQVPSSTSGLPTPTPQTIVMTPTSRPRAVNWSGPELWDAVNTRRKELGVNPLNNQSELCTIASIRLNELLELGKLDGHEGFSTLPERRPDLQWIFDKYDISEFLVSGAQSAQEAVALWENTLGHSKLMTGGEYVWGCTYAQNTFGVAIAAY